jgi:K+-transporting ATPase ATPase A chain
MTGQSLLQYLLFLAIVIACARPLGLYLFRVFTGGRTWLDPLLSPLERGLYRLAGVE